MKRMWLALLVVAAGCVSQTDVRKPLQEHLAATGRVMGFALDAEMQALETRLAVVEAEPKLQATLGKPEEIRKKVERVQQEKLALEQELKAIKDRYPLEDEEH